MTPTTSTSSILLLNPIAQGGKVPVPVDIAAPSGAALSGFQLLLGAFRQLQQPPVAAGSSGETEPEATAPAAGEGGNALPLVGTILPWVEPQPTASGVVEPTTETAEKEDTDDMASELVPMPTVPAAAPMVPTPAGFLVQSQPPRTGATVTPELPAAVTLTTFATSAASTAAAGSTADAGFNAASPSDDTATALAAQMDPADGGTAGNGAMVAGNGGIAQPGRTDPDSFAAMPIGEAAAGKAIAKASNVLDGSAAVNAAPAVPVGKGLPGAAIPAARPDFEALIKQFDASATSPSASPSLAPSQPGDTSSVQQASRTYFQAANSSAVVPVPVGNNGWSDAIADKVMWFSANKIASAEIHLNPPDLGPLQVRVNTQNDQASVVFTSHHAAVREALDQALPRLRDLMGSQGVQLLDVSVGGQGAQQRQFGSHESGERAASAGGVFNEEPAEAAAAVTTVNTARLSRPGVDAYA